MDAINYPCIFGRIWSERVQKVWQNVTHNNPLKPQSRGFASWKGRERFIPHVSKGNFDTAPESFQHSRNTYTQYIQSQSGTSQSNVWKKNANFFLMLLLLDFYMVSIMTHKQYILNTGKGHVAKWLNAYARADIWSRSCHFTIFHRIWLLFA